MSSFKFILKNKVFYLFFGIVNLIFIITFILFSSITNFPYSNIDPNSAKYYFDRDTCVRFNDSNTTKVTPIIKNEFKNDFFYTLGDSTARGDYFFIVPNLNEEGIQLSDDIYNLYSSSDVFIITIHDKVTGDFFDISFKINPKVSKYAACTISLDYFTNTFKEQYNLNDNNIAFIYELFGVGVIPTNSNSKRLLELTQEYPENFSREINPNYVYKNQEYSYSTGWNLSIILFPCLFVFVIFMFKVESNINKTDFANLKSLGMNKISIYKHNIIANLIMLFLIVFLVF